MSKQAIHKKLFNAEVTKYATQIYNDYYKGKTEDEIMTFRNEFDVIGFWFDNRGTYQMLAEIAVKILEIPAQSSCPERVFSALSYLLLNNRRHIHHDLVGKMVINYMIKHRKDQGKLRPYPPQGKEWPADARGIARLPDLEVEQLHDVDELPEDEFAEIAGERVPTIEIDGDRLPFEDDYDSAAEEDYEIEGAIYPSDREPPPVRRNGVRHDYAAMNSGK